MDKELIAQKAHDIKNKLDLLALINEVKASEIGDKAYPISMRQLNFHCNPNRLYNRYIIYKIPKKTGGFRSIYAPNAGLKNVQMWLNRIFEAIYTPSDYAMGFATGRNVAKNAAKHTGKNYVFNIDLKDFFPSIQQARVWKRLQLAPFNFPQEVANILAGLCCVSKPNENKELEYFLPQGAPTSPLLTNAICDTLDRRLAGLAKRFGLDYSRYADDITFSSMHNVYAENGEFMTELKRIIEDQHFTINDKKTRLQKKGSRQEVTGLIVCDKVNTTRRYDKEIRSLLYIWERYGYSVAFSRFYPRYKAEKGHVKKGNPELMNVLSGKLLYLKMVKGEDDSTYKRLNTTFERLVNELNGNKANFEDTGLSFIETHSISGFEKLHGCTVEISRAENGNWQAWFFRNEKKQWVRVSSLIDEIDKKKLDISWCERDKRKFYLIHYRMSKRTQELSMPKKVTPDDILSTLYNSNFDLNTLINDGN